MDTPALRPRLEVADILRVHGEAYEQGHRVSVAQQAVMRHIAECRTAALGGHVDACDTCGKTRVSYNSCRDRHCPKCQGLKKAEWLEARGRHLLPVPYWHLVFTLPDSLRALALGNKRLVFNMLFDTAADALQTLARDPKHLGVQLGFTAVLHTWGQNLLFHPHLHCVVTGGGLDPRGRWTAARPSFFLPVKVLGCLFRGKFLHALAEAYRQGQLEFDGSTAELIHPAVWRRFVDRLYRTDWVVYAKPPFGGPKHVLRYLGHYTHRVAISNHRLLALDNGRVRFKVRDYADANRTKTLTLDAVEFIRRFLLHVLPRRFVRIRHYGLLAARNIKTKLGQARNLLSPTSSDADRLPSTPPPRATWWQSFLRLTGIDLMACPFCGNGRLVRQELLLVGRSPP